MYNIKWTLVEINGQFFAQSNDKKKKIFKDWHKKDLCLGEDKEFAQSWVNTRNHIENIDYF